MNDLRDSAIAGEALPAAVTESFISLELFAILEEVAAHAVSLPGKRHVLESLPGTDGGEIRADLDRVGQLREMIGLGGLLGLAGLVPMEGVFDRLGNSAAVLDAEEILAVADLVAIAGAVRDRLTGLEPRLDLLRSAGSGLADLGFIRNRIAGVLDEHGMVKSSASPRLAQIRERSRAVRGRIHKMLERTVNDRDLARVVQEDYVSMRNDRYVILLRPEFRGLLDGIVHDNSRSGASVYVEPLDVVELNNQVASLMDEDREEVFNIFREVTEDIRSWAEELSGDYSLLSWLDAVQARALYAAHTDSVNPEFSRDGFRIMGARHPLLQASSTVKVVPMDVMQDASTLVTVISGANMGGKTVALKIAGLFPLMARCAIMLPAQEGTAVCLFSRIMADIGDEQDIRGRVSSFSGHMLRIKSIIDTAREGDLVLLDELGSSTDPEEGAALAMGITDELMSRGVRMVVTTHLSHLKAYGLGRSEVKNVSVEFQAETLKPTFRLLYDLPGESHAIVTAERIGLPPKVIEAARRYVDKAAGGTSRLMQSLREKVSEVEEQRRSAEELRIKLEEELADISSGRDRIIDEVRKEAREVLRKAEKEIGDLQRSLKSGEVKDRQKPRLELVRIKQEVVQGLGTPLEKQFTLPTIGARVAIKSLGKKGTVQSVHDKSHVEVAIGKVRVRAALEDLVILEDKAAEKSSSKNKRIRIDIPLATPRREVNVIGLRADEAIPVVDKAVDEALVGGLSSVVIIHGKGTGRLKQAIRDHLSGHSLVRGLHSGDIHMGGEGITVVDLEVD